MTFEELASLRKIAMNKAKELIEIAKVFIISSSTLHSSSSSSSSYYYYYS